MNTRKQKLIAVSVIFAIVIVTVSPAQAGILDWFRSSGARADLAQNGSFDSLYATVLADRPDKAEEFLVLMANAIAPVNSPVGGSARTLRQAYWVQVSGYNSEVAQTDDSPFITAKGTHVRWGIVASNMFPFGTVIKIPSLYGDQIFVVEDRMNSRYQQNVDIWFESKADALALGRRMVQIEVIR
jgi:3D (Asp-Asp-Asp) domain-containing protein